MNSFDKLVELFAISHKDFAHNPNAKSAKDKSYYRIAAIDTQSEFVRNHNTAHTPAIAYSNLADIEVKGKDVSANISVWFLVKAKATMSQTQKQDDNSAFLIREQLRDYAIEFLEWLNVYKAKNPNDPAVRGIRTDDVTMGGIPVMYEGWWVLGLQFEFLSKLSNCINSSHYREVDAATLKVLEETT